MEKMNLDPDVFNSVILIFFVILMVVWAFGKKLFNSIFNLYDFLVFLFTEEKYKEVNGKIISFKRKRIYFSESIYEYYIRITDSNSSSKKYTVKVKFVEEYLFFKKMCLDHTSPIRDMKSTFFLKRSNHKKIYKLCSLSGFV